MIRFLDQDGSDPRISVFLKGGHPVVVAFRVEGVGSYPTYGSGTGQFPAQVHVTDHQETDVEVGEGGVVVSSVSVCDSGDRF